MLFESLSAGLSGRHHARLCPAGSGKTVLLRSWVEAAGLGAPDGVGCRSSADEQDAQRLWLSVVDALRSITPATEGP